MTKENSVYSDMEDLRVTVEQYAALTDGWFWESDAQHRITYVSRGVEALVGSPPEAFIGKSRTEYSLADSLDPAAWQRHKDDLNEQRPVRNFTYKFSGPMGECWIRVDGNPIFGKDGRFLGYRGIAKNITAQVENENVVATLAAAVEQFPSPVCIWGTDNTLATCNAAFLASFPEMPSPVCIGMPYAVFIRQLAEYGLTWPTEESPEDWVNTRVRTPHSQTDTAIARVKTGRTYRLERRPLDNRCTISLCIDLTDILEAKEEAQDARRKLTDALNALDTPFAYYDREDRLKNWNDAFTQMNHAIGDLVREGVSFETLLDAIIERNQIVGIEGREGEFRESRLAAHGLSNIRTERQISDGRWFMVREVGTSDGGIVGIWTDISELKDQQAELEHARHEAEEASRLKSGFLANISHELRTPLNSISGFVHMLEDRNLGEQEQVLVSRLSTSTDMLIELVNDLLDLSLAEAGELRVNHANFSVLDILDDIACILKPVADAKGVAYQTFVSEDFPEQLLGDRMRIRQILLNFADNAVKFTHHGTVRIESRLEGRSSNTGTEKADILFEIRDTGIGIPSDSLRDVLTPFFQDDISSTREYGGAGLGLSISKKLADLMGGAIDIQSKTGEGTVLTLKLTLPVPRFATSRHGAPDQSPTCHSGLSGAIILVVDDQSLNRQILRSVLTRAGCIVYEAVDGEEAVNIVTSSKVHFFDAILMDIQMPKLDGFAATSAILAVAKGNAPPIIALTAHSMESERRKCIAAGMCDHLQKPVEPERLFTTLSRWTSGRREGYVPSATSIKPAPQPADDESNLDEKVEPAVAAHTPEQAADLYVNLVRELSEAIDDEALARELLTEFSDTYGDAADKLRSLVNDGRVDAAKDFAHRVKGVSGNLRLIDLHDASMMLETRLTAIPRLPDEIHEALDTLETIHLRIVNSIQTSAKP